MSSSSALSPAGPDALCFRTAGRDSRRGHERPSPSSRSRAGERIPLVHTYFPSHEPVAGAVRRRGRRSRRPRTTGSTGPAACSHRTGAYHEEIHQSLLVFKALTYAPRGGSWRRRRRRCRKRSAAFATGTIATAGCAMRR